MWPEGILGTDGISHLSAAHLRASVQLLDTLRTPPWEGVPDASSSDGWITSVGSFRMPASSDSTPSCPLEFWAPYLSPAGLWRNLILVYCIQDLLLLLTYYTSWSSLDQWTNELGPALWLSSVHEIQQMSFQTTCPAYHLLTRPQSTLSAIGAASHTGNSAVKWWEGVREKKIGPKFSGYIR